jgi:hypothetical protein
LGKDAAMSAKNPSPPAKSLPRFGQTRAIFSTRAWLTFFASPEQSNRKQGREWGGPRKYIWYKGVIMELLLVWAGLEWFLRRLAGLL